MSEKKKPAQGLSKARIDAIVGKALEGIRAPAVHTSDRADRRTKEDLRLQALDEGLSQESLEQSLRDEESTFRQAGTRSPGARQVFRAARTNGINPISGERILDNSVGMKFASYVGHVAMARGNFGQAYRMARANGAPSVVTRALGEATLAGGGALVQTELANDFMELLYASTAYLQGGPISMQLSSGSAKIGGLATGASASWVGENAEIAKSEQTFREASLSLKKLAVLTPVSNDLIMHADRSMEEIVRNDLVEAAGVAIDSAMIRGTGTAFSPTGLKESADSGSAGTFSSTGVTAAAITADLNKMQRLMADQKVKGAKAAYLMSPRSFFFLMSLRDGNNNLIFAPELAQGRLQGKPVFVTHNIPDNLSTDKSEVYLVDFAHEIFAEGVGSNGLRLDMFDGGTYTVSGTATSGISNDQTVIRLIQYADRASRQLGKNIILLTTVAWGA